MLPEQQLRAYVDYLRDMGIYDLYRRETPQVLLPEELREKLARGGEAFTPAVARPPAGYAAKAETPRPAAQPACSSLNLPARPGVDPTASMPRPPSFDALAPIPERIVSAPERAGALEALRAEIGDCPRCPLAYAGRHTIVFADGDPNARLMFVGEGPGADEDATGLPFVGKAGQLLNNMIGAMGLKREEVYIANIVKCRPPGNRAPEFLEATTCSQFLLRQIDIVRPEIIVALGKTAANYLLGNTASLTSQRGRWMTLRAAKLLVTFHPAFLLRDPRQKGEAWKDLQLVMSELGLSVPKRTS